MTPQEEEELVRLLTLNTQLSEQIVESLQGLLDILKLQEQRLTLLEDRR